MTAASLAAMEWIEPYRPTAMWRIMRYLAEHETAICPEMEAAFGGLHQSVSARLNDLEALGIVSHRFGIRQTETGSHSLYGLTQNGVLLMLHADAADRLKRLVALHGELTRERAEANRAQKAEWKRRIERELREALKREVGG